MTERPSSDLTILLKAFEHTETHHQQLRERALTIHTWIGSVLLAVIGGIVALDPQQTNDFTKIIQVTLTMAVLSLFLFGWLTEVFTFQARVKEGRAAVIIVDLLKLFEPNSFGTHPPIFDKHEWTAWKESVPRRIGIAPATAVLGVLTFVTLILIWTG